MDAQVGQSVRNGVSGIRGFDTRAVQTQKGQPKGGPVLLVEAAGIEPLPPAMLKIAFLRVAEVERCCQLLHWRVTRVIRGAPMKRAARRAALFYWWRRRVSNPRPQALRYELYMLIPSLISLRATRRAGKTCNQLS